VHAVPSGHTQYENIPGWDQYRTQIALLAILAPSAASDIAQSLVNDAQQGGGSLPRWEQGNADSHGMSGDDGDVIIANAYAFGATNFDTAGAFKAMVGGQAQIREGFADYARLGYVPADLSSGLSSASVTLEYANDDFAIAQFAKALGNSSAYNTYLQRSANWLNLLNTASQLVQPRNANGSWVQGFDPASQNGFQEGNSAQYSWMVSFNLAGLFSQMGGNSAAAGRLDTFFSKLNAGPNSPFAWMGNEPSVEVPWEYDFALAPSHTQDMVRRIETRLWANTPGGMPGNDDGGEMSSWYVFAAMGLYPEITSIGGFVIGSPLFSSAALYLTGGIALQINAPEASDDQRYVQSLKLNGNPTTSLWLPWTSVQNGATLDFTLGGSASSWGSSPQDAPPSFPPHA
jgi:predicted alpha-1,2-mannosidase